MTTAILLLVCCDRTSLSLQLMHDPIIITQGLTRAIVNPETLSNSVSRSDSHHEGIHTSTGYQAVVEPPLNEVMGERGFDNQP